MSFLLRCEYTKLVPITQLVPHPKNPKKHSKEAVERQAEVMDYQGWRRPINVSNRSGFMTAGHKRLLAAKLRKETEVPVSFQDYDSEDQEIADVVADNALNEWELTDLKTVNEMVADLGPDFDINMLGIKDFVLDFSEKGLTDEDEIPEGPVEARTRSGDLYSLGSHRLLCGDSTKPEDVKRLLGDVVPDAVVTDPPYSVNYDRSQAERGGKLDVHSAYKEADLDPGSLLSFIGLVRTNVLIMSYPIDRHFFDLAAVLKHYSFEFRKELVWVKDSFSFWMGAKYQQKHEPILVCVKKGAPLGGDVPSNQSTVFEFARPRAHDLHPTAKPVELWELLVKYHVPLNGVVYEPFCGSGTTIIAAEKLSRKCFGMEMSPNYCDVIVERWENFTGKKAELLT